MKRCLFALIALLGASAATPAPRWSAPAIEQLRRAVDSAGEDGLPRIDTAAVQQAAAAGDPARLDTALDEAALKLARLHLLGASQPRERGTWRIPDTDRAGDLPARLAGAVAAGQVDGFFASLRPLHPDYAALRAALAAETDPVRRTRIARNMERWRWMPQSLGDEYLLVNAAAFEASLWRAGSRAASWRVIVGKTASPTPVFSATVGGVIINPWWDVPGNIVAEGIGSLVRKNPAAARARGYVWSGGHIRQRPGPGNSLGQMKLVMPNPYAVYLHDTPNKALFDKEVRAFSHGCVRVGDALGLAATLLEGVKTRAEVDALVARGDSVTVPIARPIPVYIAYFTAGTRADGSFALFPDIYGREAGAPKLALNQSECGATKM